MHKILKYSAALVSVVVLASCSGNKGWSVEGTVEGGADSVIVVEASVFNNWTPLDTLRLSDGEFSFTAEEAAPVPSVYRLNFGGRYIYFPVDSIETVEVKANAARFDRGYTLAGNNAARGMMMADSLIAAAVDANGAAAASSRDLKQQLTKIVNRDSTCIVSYYIVGKRIGNKPIFDDTDKVDLRTLANAANNFKIHRPNDPRAAQLEQRWLQARRALGTNGGAVQMEATINGRPDADLKRYDAEGKQHDFDEIADRGGVTVLNFTRYDGEASQANTVALKSVYDAYHGNGLEIFQIAYDPDEISWKRSAENMPWISVWNSPTDNIEALINYNVDPINGAPVSFVFNRQGELVERVADPTKLSAIVAKYL